MKIVDTYNEQKIKFNQYLFWFAFAMLMAVSVIAIMSGFKDKPNYSTMQARMRVSRSASLTLSTTWTKVDFSGTSTYNVNTFAIDPNNSGNPLVYWDPTNKIFKFYNTADVNYDLLNFRQ